MNADEILKKHEDANEMHFYEADRKWIIEAMEEYAALCQPPVSGALLAVKIEEALAKYWYDTGCNHIDESDHKKAEESRVRFKKK